MSAKYYRVISNRRTSNDRVASRIIRKRIPSQPRKPSQKERVRRVQREVDIPSTLWRDYSPPPRSCTPTPPPVEMPEDTGLDNSQSSEDDDDGNDSDMFEWQGLPEENGTDELECSMDDEQTEEKQEATRPPGNELPFRDFEMLYPQIMVDNLHFYRDGIALLLTPIPPPDPKVPNFSDPRPQVSIRQVLEEQDKLLCPSNCACIFTVYYWEWDPLSNELPHIKIWKTENCVREANIQAGNCVRGQVNQYRNVKHDYLPDPHWDRNGEYVDLNYNPLACHLYEYRTKRLSNGKEYRAWVTMSALRICEACEGPPGKQ